MTDRLRRLTLAIAVVIAAPLPNANAETAPTASPIEHLLTENRHSIKLAGGSLSGPGAELLLEAAGKAQFFVIGEQHNAKEIPEFTAALFRQLHQRHGYRHLALEQDPVAVGRATASPLRGRTAAIASFAKRYPAAFTFNTDQELSLIASVGEVATGPRPIWGLDQVFGATHVLDRLVMIAPDARTRNRTAALAERVRQLETEQLARKSRFMSAEVQKPTEFLALPSFYRRTPGSEADILIEQLFKSLDIYRDWSLAVQYGQPTRYRQSFEREENMKRLFMVNYMAAQSGGEKTPKVLLKFGHNHSLRGTNRSGILTLGNFVSEFAKSNNLGSFHLAVYANNDHPGYYDILSSDADYGPLMRAASPTEWAVVDLRPLRPLAFSGAIPSLTPEQRNLIFGFDAALLIGGQVPGTYELTSLHKSPKRE